MRRMMNPLATEPTRPAKQIHGQAEPNGGGESTLQSLSAITSATPIANTGSQIQVRTSAMSSPVGSRIRSSICPTSLTLSRERRCGARRLQGLGRARSSPACVGSTSPRSLASEPGPQLGRGRGDPARCGSARSTAAPSRTAARTPPLQPAIAAHQHEAPFAHRSPRPPAPTHCAPAGTPGGGI